MRPLTTGPAYEADAPLCDLQKLAMLSFFTNGTNACQISPREVAKQSKTEQIWAANWKIIVAECHLGRLAPGHRDHPIVVVLERWRTIKVRQQKCTFLLTS